MITNLNLKNFTVFKDLSIDFSSKINVIFGENGTGKSHLLKAAYSLCSANNDLSGQVDLSEKDIKEAVTSKLLGVFLPPDRRLGKMRKVGVAEDARMSGNFVFDKVLTVTFRSNSKSVTVREIKDYARYSWNPIFIPTKEILTSLKGFRETDMDGSILKLIFDQTYFDLAAYILSETDQEPSPREEWLLERLVNAMGGRFSLEEGEMSFQPGTYIEYADGKAKDGKLTYFSPQRKDVFSSHMMAEGFRKFGMLQRLLKNRSLVPGVSGTLFWDEPESNINPKLMGLIVDSLLTLARSEQQIIIATHDYILLKWFDLLAQKDKGDHVCFHALFRGQDGEVYSESTDDYSQISSELNAIDEAFADVADKEIEREMGGLGK